MKAVLLCAGRGSRLLPMTDDIPKCLVPVDGKPILDHQIANFQAAGVTEFVIVAGYRAQAISDHIRRYAPTAPITFVFNPFWSLTSSIASLWIAREHLTGDFCVANGDVIISANILIQAQRDLENGIHLLVQEGGEHNDDMRVALERNAEEQKPFITAVGKHLPRDIAKYRSLGVIYGRNDAGRYRQEIDSIMAEHDGPQYFHHQAVHRLAQAHRVSPLFAVGDWMEIDSTDDIAAWQKLRQENQLGHPARNKPANDQPIEIRL